MQIRFNIGNVVSVTLGIALGLAVWSAPYDVSVFVLLLCGAALVTPWIRGPIRLHRTHYQSSVLVMVPIEPEGAETPREIRRIAYELKGLGFSLLRVYRMDKHVPNVKGYISLHYNPQTCDVAKVLVSFGRSTRVSFVVFGSELFDGTLVMSSNSDFLILTPPLREGTRSMTFPEIRDTDQLYAVHQARMIDEARRPPAIGDPEAYLKAFEDRILDHHVNTGYYYRVEDERILRPTLKGAILMAWKHLWPVPPIRRAWKRLHARMVLRRLRLPSTVKFPDAEL